MFDIGFSELLLFGVIALIVLGPEKLPQAARTVGQWYAKIRRTVSTLQSEIEAELDLAETRQQMQKELAKIRQTEAEMRREMAEMRGSMQEFSSSQNQHLKAAHQPTTDKVDNTNNKNDGEKGGVFCCLKIRIKILYLNTLHSFNCNELDIMLRCHRMLDLAHLYMHDVVLHRVHGHMLFNGCIRCSGNDLGHLLPAAHHRHCFAPIYSRKTPNSLYGLQLSVFLQ